MLWFRKSQSGLEKESLPPITFEQVQTWQPQEGDVLVVTVDHRLRPVEAARIRDKLREWFPDNRLMILDEGVQFQVVRKEDEISVSPFNRPKVTEGYPLDKEELKACERVGR